MLEKDAIMAKINTINNCLKAISKVTQNGTLSLNDFTIENIVVLNLQRACQAAIDMAQITISYKKLSLPNSYKNAFKVLADGGVLTPEVAIQMGKMAGFRNISVHDYTEINDAILQSIIENHLDDFHKYSAEILKLFQT